ncbi:MAG: energy-coupling factor ABC transporter ATP-binding protein [Lachnospiraceae bacterium]|nr:energy-coupling factor ABC transporter ATP-binding protein [Lachnospiraceae bacterium]
MNKEALIRLEHIYFSYDGENRVLEDYDLTVQAGECLIVKGDNGAGKSTLFRILNGLSFPDSGRYIFGGDFIDKEYLQNDRNFKRFHQRIGYLFQNHDIMLFNGRVYDEIAYGPRQMGLSDEETDTRVRDCMELFGIGNLADKAPYHLSNGQKKLVALTAVLALNPEVLVMDEPFAGLDKGTKEKLIDFLKAYREFGKTIIIATHEDELELRLGGRVEIMIKR